jgi:hypothetical protein
MAFKARPCQLCLQFLVIDLGFDSGGALPFEFSRQAGDFGVLAAQFGGCVKPELVWLTAFNPCSCAHCLPISELQCFWLLCLCSGHFLAFVPVFDGV